MFNCCKTRAGRRGGLVEATMHRYQCRLKPCVSSVVSLQQPLLAAAAAALLWLKMIVVADAASPPIGLPGCRTRCGNVSVPYLFGIEPGCYLQGFNLTCNTSYPTPRMVLWLGIGFYVVNLISLKDYKWGWVVTRA